ncbi:hypothetical protein BD779DRAFT_902327 [Infundibulicybe gibba]|nr:hypothetical protein BD779DRAFT_902327 [Infundibulicybe gibba]
MQHIGNIQKHPQTSIRRRSGCYLDRGKANINTVDSALASTSLAEDSDKPNRQPAALSRRQASPNLLQPPVSSNSSALSITLSPKLPSSRTPDAHEESTTPFSQIPLTPRPDVPPHTASIASSQISQIPRLPTPDFASVATMNASTFTTQATAALRAVLARGLSAVSSKSFATAISLRSAPPPYRPRSTWRASKASFKSTSSGRSTSSIDSGHTFLIPSIGTTDKFTHKWPKPHSLRRMEGRAGVKGEVSGWCWERRRHWRWRRARAWGWIASKSGQPSSGVYCAR